jgi:hypothetical protein
MNRKHRTWLLPVVLVTGLGVTGCHLDSSHGVVTPPAPQPYVTVSESTNLVDPSTYHSAAWLTVHQLPYPELAWQLVRSYNSHYFPNVSTRTTSCEPASSYDEPTSDPVPTTTLSDVFWGTPPTGANRGPGRLVATETQYFYPSVTDSGAAFATLVATFTDCAKKAGSTPDPGTIPLGGASGPVVHTVSRTVAGAAAGAWVHTVRFADGTAPMAGGYSYMEYPDSHYAVARRANVLDVLELTGTSAIDVSSGDGTLVTTMATNLAGYDLPPTPGTLSTDHATRMWQAWPPPQSFPAPPGATWSGDVPGGTSVDPKTGGPLGNLACTQITATTAKDPALRLDDQLSYRASSPRPDGPRLVGNATILAFADPATARTGYAQLNADMTTCAARLRVLQTQASRPADATVALLDQGPVSSVWTLTATGYVADFASILPAQQAPDRDPHHVMILVRGLFVEVIDLSGSGQQPYTLITDRAVIAAAGSTLCNFKIDCS